MLTNFLAYSLLGAVDVLLLGFLIPSFISAPSTLAVFCGVAMAVLFGPLNFVLLRSGEDMLKKICLLIGALAISACSRVEPGNVGIKVNLLGGSKGVDQETLGVGRYWIGINEELYVFPTFQQNYTWEGDEAFEFQDRDGLTLKTPLGISWQLDAVDVPTIFQKYRRGVDEIMHIFIRNAVRDALVIHAGTMPVDQIYGPGKAALLAAVTKDAQSAVLPVKIIALNWVGAMELPDTVKSAINAKIGATQMAAQRENEVAQAKAEADKRRAEAQGEADALLSKAAAEAQAYQMKIDALSKNPDGLTKLQAIEKWDGKLPTWLGGDTPIPFMSVK